MQLVHDTLDDFLVAVTVTGYHEATLDSCDPDSLGLQSSPLRLDSTPLLVLVETPGEETPLSSMTPLGFITVIGTGLPSRNLLFKSSVTV